MIMLCSSETKYGGGNIYLGKKKNKHFYKDSNAEWTCFQSIRVKGKWQLPISPVK